MISGSHQVLFSKIAILNRDSDSDFVTNRAFSHEVKTAVMMFQNNEMTAMLVYHDNPVGFEPFSHVKAFFCSDKFT